MMKAPTEQLNIRIDRKIAREIRVLVLRKHGKLHGKLGKEIERAIELHIQRLEAENNDE